MVNFIPMFLFILDTLEIAAVDQETGIGFVTDYFSSSNISQVIQNKNSRIDWRCPVIQFLGGQIIRKW